MNAVRLNRKTILIRPKNAFQTVLLFLRGYRPHRNLVSEYLWMRKDIKKGT